MCNEHSPWEDIAALNSTRLIALDKDPGVRPLGIADPLRRLIFYAVLEATGDEAQAGCGSRQLCVGMKSGTEGAFHTVREMLEDVWEKGGALLVDADNGFNRLNSTRR
eukprot:GHVN01026436.1.p1 GENE.GHVN01026436.1~~GHVN01026436.1.p1  ORF type:complete len:108 (-),score=12.53 GHVN01026436.1:360-683(-)